MPSFRPPRPLSCARARAVLAALAVVGALAVVDALAGPAAAADAPVPAPLQPWIPWVLRGQESAACARFADGPVCAWPGRLTLQLHDGGGSFRLAVRADAEVDVPVPGDTVRWPRDLRVDGTPAALGRATGGPVVRVPAGEHVVSGTFSWARLPESLAVPASIALVDLEVRGAAARNPRRDVDGLLWLQAGAVEEAEEDRVGIEVHRRIDDGVPVTTTTRLRLRVSGRSREVDLGRVLLPGQAATALASSLPARLDGDGRLQVQLRPGDWEVRVDARSSGPVTAATPPDLPSPWPDEETWVFQASPSVRSVRVDGPPGVDPARTSLPDEWRALPAWRVARGTEVRFVELRRGEAEPPPDQVDVARTLWLALDGGGFAAKDRLSGSLNQGGRLELAAPGVLGRAAVGGVPQLVTEADGRGGVEVRDRALQLEATGTWPASGAIPAVGWDRDASSLSMRIELPPGWRLLAALGVDDAPGSWLDAWTLMDLFLVLVVGLGIGQLVGPGWGAASLAFLALSWQEPHAPRIGWIVLLASLGLLRALKGGPLARALSLARWGILLVVAAQAVTFGWSASRAAFFPQLEQGGRGPLDGYGWSGGGFDGGTANLLSRAESIATPMAAAPPAEPAFDQVAQGEFEQSVQGKSADRGGAYPAKGVGSKRAARLDPQAVVQTGPGLPRWSWSSHELVFRGPVAQDHEVRLFLVGPVANGVLGLLRVLGAAGLLLLLADARRTRTALAGAPPAARAAPALLVVVAALAAAAPGSASAQGFPSQELLGELGARLLQRPPCEPECVQIPSLTIAGTAGGLRLEAEVHAEALAPLRLPGPDASFVPARVELDGVAVVALRRDAEGFLALRVPAGVHRLVVEGPARDEVALQLPVIPKVLRFEGDGWTITGLRPDAPPPGSVQLSRARALEEEGAEADGSAELPPWLQVRRELDLGVPWVVHTELRRLGGGGRAVQVRVPLLPGESVTSSGVPVEAGEALVTLEPGEVARAWDSTLAEAPELTLTAPVDRPFTEVWALDCSPIFSCRPRGLAPTRHLVEDRWLPEWSPWPGESITIALTRPAPAEGVTSTIDAATLELTSGRRMLESSLQVSLRSSQGGEHALELPDGATLRTFRIDGRDHPVQPDGRRLVFAIEPGAHEVAATWSADAASGMVARAPTVGLGQDAANVQISWTLPEHRWVLWAWGPRWGPVVTVWQYVLVLVLVAVLLGRIAPTPLRAADWFLLGLGLTQVPPGLGLVVVAWLSALGLRGRWTPPSWWQHLGAQGTLLVGTFVALGVLYGAVWQGLVVEPDLGVVGAGSHGRVLRWFADRSDASLPTPGVFWLPLWCWRVAMLLWALWLASRLLRWLRWGWEQAGFGGLLTVPPFLRRGPAAPGVPALRMEVRGAKGGEAGDGVDEDERG